MDQVVKKDTTPNEVYVKRYKDFIRLMRIYKMLRSAKITKSPNQK